MTADRHDKNKAELDYIDTFWVALEGVARNCMYGASKYDLFNYMKGAKSSRESYNCARRHELAWLRGEDLVPDALEAGFEINHIDAAIWNWMRLRQELHDFPERDDRPHKVLERAKVAVTPTLKVFKCWNCDEIIPPDTGLRLDAKCYCSQECVGQDAPPICCGSCSKPIDGAPYTGNDGKHYCSVSCFTGPWNFPIMLKLDESQSPFAPPDTAFTLTTQSEDAEGNWTNTGPIPLSGKSLKTIFSPEIVPLTDKTKQKVRHKTARLGPAQRKSSSHGPVKSRGRGSVSKKKDRKHGGLAAS